MWGLVPVRVDAVVIVAVVELIGWDAVICLIVAVLVWGGLLLRWVALDLLRWVMVLG